ncbi:MAG: murein biosynthesis integral membrane protein MurJ [Pseudanabaenaceae cyanobacterium]
MSKRSLAGIALVVAVGTLLSKVFGLFRQMAIAAAFGVGVVFDAYNYAYVIPGFLLILLGGINGPFHSAIVSVLAKREGKSAGALIETINTVVGLLLLVLTVLLFIWAEPLTDLVAPGLSSTARGLETRQIAIEQLRIMAPMALFSGLIGIGFGCLNAVNQFWLPSVSPLLSSLTVLIGLGGLALVLGKDITAPAYAYLGGSVLAWSTLAGAVCQWLVQIPAQIQAGLGGLRLRFDLQQEGVRDILQIMAPATFSSGMVQINVFVILFFASYIPQAAAALGYASLLVQTPLGVLSNVILVPFFPVFSRLAVPDQWQELKARIRQCLVFTGITMLPLGALMTVLAVPIVQVVYERYAFDAEATKITADMLVVYSLGMFVYLGRDVLVRVFYALGDGVTPFRISVVNIFLNALFAHIFVQWIGASGLVLATVAVNIISMLALVVALDRALNGIPWLDWSLPILGLTLTSGIGGLVSWGTMGLIQPYLQGGFIRKALLLLGAGGVGAAVFLSLTILLRLPELTQLWLMLKQKFFSPKNQN